MMTRTPKLVFVAVACAWWCANGGGVAAAFRPTPSSLSLFVPTSRTTRTPAQQHQPSRVGLLFSTHRSSSSRLFARPPQTPSAASNKKKKKKRSPRYTTLEGLSNQVLQNTAKYLPEGGIDKRSKKKKKSNSRRTRRRVENPQQTYVYAAQKQQQQLATTKQASPEQELARDVLGMMPAAQHTDALYGDLPVILGRVKVLPGSIAANAYAYLIDKPAGWSILGSKRKGAKAKQQQEPEEKTTTEEEATSVTKKRSRSSNIKKVVIKDAATGKIDDVLEWNELDVFAMMTNEEIEEFLEDGGELPPGFEYSGSNSEQPKPDDDEDENDNLPFDPYDNNEEEDEDVTIVSSSSTDSSASDSVSAATQERLRRIAAREDTKQSTTARFSSDAVRPSLVTWLKEEAFEDQKTIRGGTYWKALAGATAVDDSGVVLLCPKSATDQVHVDSMDFLAIVGNGDGGGGYNSKQPSPRPNNRNALNDASDVDDHDDEEAARAAMLQKEGQSSQIQFQTLAKLRKGRGDDVVQTVRVRASPERKPLTCDDVAKACCEEYQDSIRGDATSHPLDRRARRRLIHCQHMLVSSLLLDDDFDEDENDNDVACKVETRTTPDDIAVFSDRQGRSQQSASSSLFRKGSFLGRSVLRQGRDDMETNAYREINGAADGFPGWIVDRYDKWLLVQHDPDATAEYGQTRGPLPSIHDGHTAGIYYMNTSKTRKPEPPVLLEGQPAPDLFPVVENGIQYLVSFNDLSTGIFLDQRPQRAWLAKNCCSETRVLNCFAHTGAFSVAAATAGASTVSLDLSQRWLDRLPQHLQANGIEFDERHDAIYGDCFDWLVRLAKRGETFDVVILDPPSTSVGGRKKRRWSVKNDMAELVQLALPLVKKGGLLWTTTNSATLSPMKFARLCRKGFEDAAATATDANKKTKATARLERIQPMPSDHPSVGPQPVKNLVWRVL